MGPQPREPTRGLDRPAALEAILDDEPEALGRLLAARPRLLRDAWGDIMTMLAAARAADMERFLLVLRPVLEDRRVRRTLNDPIDADGNRVAHWPAMYGDARRLELLRAFGADLRVGNRLGTTPLFDAVRGGSPEAMEVIVRHAGRDVLHHLNGYDCSPVHWACMHCSMPGARGLHELEPGLINAPNRNGGLALDLLDWRKLYHAEAVERTFGRAPRADELRPYEELGDWMRANGARHSRAWAALPDREKLKESRAPLNAEPWWGYVRRPLGWNAA